MLFLSALTVTLGAILVLTSPAVVGPGDWLGLGFAAISLLAGSVVAVILHTHKVSRPSTILQL